VFCYFWWCLVDDPVDSDSGEPASDWWILFFVPFLAIGVGLLYAGLRMQYTEVMVLLDGVKLRVMKRFFGKVRESKLDVADVKGVWLSESHRSNDKPVYELYVEGVGDVRGVTFGSGLKDVEKRWMVGRLRLFLPEYGAGDEHVVEREAFDVKGMRVERFGDGFRVIRKHFSGKWMICGGLLTLILGGFILNDVLGEMDTEFDGWVDVVFSVFQVVPALMGLFFLLLGVGFFIRGLMMVGREDVFVFGKDWFEVEKRKGGVAKGKAVRHGREDVKGVVRSAAGQMNNEDRYKVEVRVKGGRVTLCGFVTEEVSDRILVWIEEWVSVKDISSYGDVIKVGPPAAKVTISKGKSEPLYKDRKRDFSKGSGKWMLLLPVIFMLIGGGALFAGVKSWLAARESDSWPSVSGQVVESRVDVNSDSDGTTYSAVVIVERYSRGSEVEVFYREGEHEESVLETGITGKVYFLPGFGVVFFTVGVLVLIGILKSAKNKERE